MLTAGRAGEAGGRRARPLAPPTGRAGERAGFGLWAACPPPPHLPRHPSLTGRARGQGWGAGAAPARRRAGRAARRAAGSGRAAAGRALQAARARCALRRGLAASRRGWERSKGAEVSRARQAGRAQPPVVSLLRTRFTVFTTLPLGRVGWGCPEAAAGQLLR